jgi:hypothetical protein
MVGSYILIDIDSAYQSYDSGTPCLIAQVADVVYAGFSSIV